MAAAVISAKTLSDLEFNTVLQQVSDYCITALGKEQVFKILPISNKETLLSQLNFTNEYLASFENDNRIPNHGFDSISKELKLLNIENTYLEISGLQKISHISLTSNSLLKFFKKFKDYYPTLH
ncbi:MAG: DNA mismatch repair protein MutS, partial [Winogradskyella sp.]|nr:DNA mismatch repair protein MutS [Winogradskyella sp.]